MEQIIHPEGENGIRIGLASGMLEYGHPDRWSTLHFYRAASGDRLALQNAGEYEFAVATYALERPEKYIYTYSYQPEENWSVYNKDLTPYSYRGEDYVFGEACYFRVNVRRRDARALDASDRECIERALHFYHMTQERSDGIHPVFAEEIKKTVDEVNALRGKKLILLSDSHYVVNGTWDDTVSNMKNVARSAKMDGIIHLGDITDGMIAKRVNRDYVLRVLHDLDSVEHLPLYAVIGNHDSNYFRGNPDRFSEEEQFELYMSGLSGRRGTCCPDDRTLYYRVDFEDVRARCFFLDSFDYREEVRYGFSDRETAWFERELWQTPPGYRVLVFSHVPPLPQIHYWSEEIRNGEKMVRLLETFQERTGHRVLAWIHGHNHADAVYDKRGFPIVSVGCNKMECFTEKKPEGSVTYARRPDHVSQDLWDVLVISGDKDELRFIRFGAGENRFV